MADSPAARTTGPLLRYERSGLGLAAELRVAGVGDAGVETDPAVRRVVARDAVDGSQGVRAGQTEEVVRETVAGCGATLRLLHLDRTQQAIESCRGLPQAAVGEPDGVLRPIRQ